MEHEVFVPFPAERLRQALADPACVARAVPGLQQDAGAEPVSGRLKLRVGSHSITYRGSVRVTGRGDGEYVVEGDATESRGSGSAKLALTVRVRDAGGGAAVTFAGAASAEGRLTELPRDAVTSAVIRLLDRFTENLAQASGGEPTQAEPVEGVGGSAGTVAEAGEPVVDSGEPVAEPDERVAEAAGPAVESGEPVAEARETAAEEREEVAESGEPVSKDDEPVADDARASAFDTDVPPSSLGPDADDDGDGAAAEVASVDGEDIAEAAHARRTMIGRSAEEVDHAPPRGRYAPVPAPQTVSAHNPLRWAAPAAAVVLASAIVVGRVLRKRR